MKMKRYFAPDTRQALRALRDEQGPDAVILSNRRVNGGVEIIAAMDYEDSMVNTSLGNPDTLSDIDPYTNISNSKPGTEMPADGKPSPATKQQANPKTAAYEKDTASPVMNSATLNKIQDELTGLRNIMEAPMMQFSWGETGRVQPLYANLLKQLMTLGISSNLSQIIARKLEKEGLSKHSWLESLNHLANLVPIDERDILSSGGIISLVGPTGVGKTTTIAKLQHDSH